MNLELCKQELAMLAVKGGIRLKKGERVIIKSDIETAQMAKLVAKTCYEEGASHVEIQWSDPELDALAYQYANPKDLEMKQWEIDKWEQQVEQLPCLIALSCSDPQEYTKEMIEKRQIVEANRLPIIGKYRTAMMDKYKWTIIGVPTQAWANQVFPNEENNLMHLWNDVLSTVMINGDGSAVEKWNQKWKEAFQHMDKLNEYGFKTLHLQSELGTDLTIEMHPDGLFHAAAYRDMDYAANLPSEELYTSPLAGKAEGILVASTPLIYNDQYIDGLELTFREGKVIHVKADKGEQFFQNLVNIDEGASMLGEVAIVDKNSPIRKLGHLLYHTLFDENAACHIAIGRGFPFVLKNGKSLTPEQIKNSGINQSAIHCDIMWGTDQTKIIGVTKDNQEIVIMENGTWQI